MRTDMGWPWLFVNASEAKQSDYLSGRSPDCFVASLLAMTARELFLVPKIRLDRAVHLDGQRVAVAVLGVAGGDAHPALANAIFLDIGLLDALEADADIARENFGVVIRTARIDRQAVRQLVAC